MKKRLVLGQHFLASNSIAKSIVDCAAITKKDTVYEVGTGYGILVPYLCQAAKKVTTVEKDRELYSLAVRKFSKYSNLTLKFGDGFKMDEKFSVFISNLPYSKSKKAIEWLAEKKFLRAILMVQKEFAEKLLASSKKKRRAIGVLANYSTKIERIMDVKRSNFSPKPHVDSVVLRFTKKRQLSSQVIKTVNLLFSYRNKTTRNVAKELGFMTDLNGRFEDLTGDEIVKLAKRIVQL